MFNLAVLVMGVVVGFVGSRGVRRRSARRAQPQRHAQASSLARSVSGGLGRRKGLSAPELQRACFSEMVRHVRVNRQGRTHAPSSYVLRLHPDDLATVDEARGWFTGGLAEALNQAAQEQGWQLDGVVQITLEADPARHAGVPAALAVDPEGPARAQAESAPPLAQQSTAATPVGLERADTGERFRFGDGPLTIGRAEDRTITIDDKIVSRSHARIERQGEVWVVVDEGSSNGTRIGSTALVAHQPRALRGGDVITIGPVELKVMVARPSTRPPGTRALDDQDRTRISGQVLPPPRRPPT